MDFGEDPSEASLGQEGEKERRGWRLEASTQGTADDAGLIIVALLNVLHFDAMHGGRC